VWHWVVQLTAMSRYHVEHIPQTAQDNTVLITRFGQKKDYSHAGLDVIWP